jgi:hypothetical protein
MPELDVKDFERRLGRLADHGSLHATPTSAAHVRAAADVAVRRRRVAGVVGIALAACVLGVLAFGVPASLRGTGPVQPDPAETPTDTPSSVGPLPDRPVAVADRRVSAGQTMSLLVPDGWRMFRNHGYVPTAQDPHPTENLCVAPANAELTFGCPGLSIAAGDFLPGTEGSRYRPHEAIGWYTGSDVGPCPMGRPSTGGYFNAIHTDGGLVEQGTRPIGGLQADYDRWQAGCDDGSTFNPQAWYLPGADVLIKEVVPAENVDRILESVRFAGAGSAFETPSGRYGRLLAATPGGARIQLDGVPQDLPITDLTACLGAGRLADSVDVLVPVDCGRFGDWLAVNPGKRLRVAVYLDPDGGLAQLAEW